MLGARYHILGKAGEGGAGKVWRAEDTWADKRHVAIKRLTDGLDDAILSREFAIAYRVRHPHLVRTLDFARARAGDEAYLPIGTPYLVQAFCEGQAALAWAAGRSRDDLLVLGAQLLAGLAALHALGIRHGDVKPHNVLVSDQGHATLIDLGLASRDVRSLPAGTLGYLAPEVLDGAAQPASDVFGLAVTLAHLASGQGPRQNDIPHAGALQDVLAPLLHKDPSRRATATQAFALFAQASGDDSRLRALRDTPLPSSGFVGRSQVTQALDTLYANGTGTRIVRLVGPSGSGKTAALEEAAAQGIARRYDVPGLVRSAGRGGLDELCRAMSLQEPEGATQWERFFALAEPLSQALQNRRLALIFDDVPDDAPLEAFLRFCERMGPTGPNLVAVIAVTQGPKTQLGARDVLLAPLGEPDVRQIIQSTRPLRPQDVEATQALHKASAGLPAAIVGILDQRPGDSLFHAAQDGTLAQVDAFSARLQKQLDALAPNTKRLVLATALVSPPVPWETLRTLPSLSDVTLLDAESAVGLLRIHRGATATHLEVAALGARGFLAARAPQDLLRELTNLPLRDADLGALWQRLGDTQKARPHLVAAAKHAAETLLTDEALRLYSGLLADPELPATTQNDIRRDLARLLISLGRAEEAREHTRTLVHPEARLVDGEALLALGRYKDALAALTSGQPHAAEDTDQILALAARAAMLAGDYPRASQLVTEAQARPGARRAELLNVQGLVAFYKGELTEAQALLTRARAAAEEAQAPKVADQARANLALVLHKSGDLRAAEAAYEEAVQSAQRTRDLPKQVLRLTNLASLRQERGTVSAALASYEQAATLANLLGGRREAVRISLNRANLLVWLGDTDTAATLLQTALDDAGQLGMHTEAAYLHLVAAEIDTARGDRPKARGHIDEAKRIFGASRAATGLVECDIVLAELLAKERSPDALRLAQHASDEALKMGRERLAALGALWAACAASSTPDAQARAQALIDIGTRLDDADLLWIGFALLTQAELARGLTGAADLARVHARRYLNIAQSRIPARLEASYLTPWFRKDLVAVVSGSGENTHDTQRSFDRLLAINREIAQDHDPRRLLERIIDAAIALSGAERGFILLLDKDTQELSVGVARNIDQESLAHGELRFSRSIAIQAIERGQPLSTIDAQDDARFREYLSVHQMQLRSVLCLPLRAQAGTLGALYLDHRHRTDAFNAKDIALLASFGDQAAIALANARLLTALAQRSADLERSRLEVDELNQRLARELQARSHELDLARLAPVSPDEIVKHGMVGVGPAMREVFRVIDRVADKDVPINVQGESGTGKELVARAIHAASERKKGAFVSINCGAIPAELLESELFGHEKGAFTGAVRQKPGLFEVAQGGTLFLDEIGDMPLGMQVKLLRVLQQKEFRRVGGTVDLKSDARVVSATNRDLAALVRDGQFREDLWYRLNVVELTMPPLRARREDLPYLIEHLLKRHAGKTPPKLAKEALAALLDYDWPGNIRELENELMRALALADDKITVKDLSPKLGKPGKRTPRLSGSLRDVVEDFERMTLEHVLAEQNGKVSAAARVLGLTRAGLYKKLHKYHMVVDKS